MFIIPGLLMILNGILTHNILTTISIKYRELTFKDKHETLGRINCCLYQFYIIYRCLTDNTYTDYIETNYIFGTLMFFDMIHYIFYIDLISNYLHHILTILMIVFINSNYASIDKLIIFNHILLLFEATNPPMSISWIANKFGYANYTLFKIFGTLTFINWSAIRIFYLSYYIYTLDNLNNKLLITPFLCLNLFWFKILINIYIKLVSKSSLTTIV
jgi:hypothetical protein